MITHKFVINDDLNNDFIDACYKCNFLKTDIDVFLSSFEKTPFPKNCFFAEYDKPIFFIWQILKLLVLCLKLCKKYHGTDAYKLRNIARTLQHLINYCVPKRGLFIHNYILKNVDESIKNAFPAKHLFSSSHLNKNIKIVEQFKSRQSCKILCSFFNQLNHNLTPLNNEYAISQIILFL